MAFKRLIILGALLAPTFVFAYISPGKPTGFVNDFAGMLSPPEKSALESKLAGYKKQSGNEVSVVTIPNLGGETIENFASDLFKEWGIGQKGKDNGALLLISRDDQEARIEVGYGLEPFLTDIESGRVIRNILTPAFASGKYSEGIIASVDGIITAIGAENPVTSSEDSASSRGSFSLSFWIYLIIFVFLWLGSVLARSKSWWLGGVLGGVAGVAFYIFAGLAVGIIAFAILVPAGLLFDFLVSRAYSKSKGAGGVPPWWIGGGGLGGGGFGNGGFGGFGGGSSGGGGASGRW